jgi:hypothetical protein
MIGSSRRTEPSLPRDQSKKTPIFKLTELVEFETRARKLYIASRGDQFRAVFAPAA